ncbi:serine hydrolase domain-containing protein [Cellvibrio sp. OA-2007]|uniref:serine hydrolase domain-containing protein n=1 Tax=Cellvibrio sp. OA-2007 TaxID=529823 RepID=UPI000A9E4F47|nr:serine hydrolase domain-containing protein [Cellvibrio sp. OA-2007]
MKSKLIKYVFTSVVICGSFWFYFQVNTYPYKVARWFQPIEAKLVSVTAKSCSPEASWLNLFVDHGVTHLGAYSAQVAFLDVENALSHCEIGYKNELFGIQVSADHRYRYASTSKLITTAEILKLVSQHKIHLDDTLISFFPELTQFKDERIAHITISQLLNHKAGFNRLTLSGDPMFLRRNKPWCPQNLIELQTLTLAVNPGEKQIYSNLGYCLLGEVIHRVTGEPYRDVVSREFSLPKRDIKFINDFYYADEVKYDYRYEEWFNDSYLTLFDFDAIASSAGLSGSATALAQLLWDIHHRQSPSPFMLNNPGADCNLQKPIGCLHLGVFHYQPEKYGIALHFHQGYLPGSSSLAIVDSFGGVTVLVKSGADRDQQNPENEWIRWMYKRLSLYYTLQGKLPILSSH